MKITLLRGLMAATVLTAAAIGPADAQVRGQIAGDRIDRLEAELRDLQSVVYSVERRSGVAVRQGSEPGAGVQAYGSNDVLKAAELEQEIARLTGRIEELTFRLASQQRQIDTIMAVLGDTRGGQMGADMAGEAESDVPAPAVDADFGDGDVPASTGGPTVLRGETSGGDSVAMVQLPANEDDAYDVAYEALLAGDYDRSEAAFETYIEQFPEGVRTPEAKYLLGEIYLATGAYAEAANTFLDHVKSYPDDVRAPEAYLKLGTAFARLEKADEACKVFRVGMSKFPDMSASVKARFVAEQRKAGC